MKDVCCADCRYFLDQTSFDENGEFDVICWCQRGSVLIEVDPTESKDCDRFERFIEDI